MSSRYRRKGDSYCIELRVREVRQLFDLRDPAPFRDRDLDPGAIDYVIEAAEETPPRSPLTLEVQIAGSPDDVLGEDVLRAAFRNQFQHLREVQDLKIRRHLRQGRIAAAVGVVVLLICLALSVSIEADTTWQQIASSGLEIGGWVAIWRPVEHLVYDWWPLAARRRILDRITAASIEIHWTAPPTPAAEPA